MTDIEPRIGPRDLTPEEKAAQDTEMAALVQRAGQVVKQAAKTSEQPRKKPSYIGAPAHFKLEQACQIVCDAFDSFGCYLVGSATERADWRDVDVRMILSDVEFNRLFPSVSDVSSGAVFWEHDPRWLLMTVSITAWLREQTGLPVDFQFQPQTHANRHHPGSRHAIGLRLAPARKD